MSNLYIVMISPSLSIVLKPHNYLLIYYIVSSHDIVSLEMVYVGWVFWWSYLLTYNLASLSGTNNVQARTQLTLSLMKQFKSNRLTLH